MWLPTAGYRARLSELVEESSEEHEVHYNSSYVPVTNEEYFHDVMFARRIEATRKEQKALVKEIPYHMIPEDQKETDAEALVKEWETWKKYGAADPFDLEASQAAEEAYPKERFLDTRACYRDKNAGYP